MKYCREKTSDRRDAPWQQQMVGKNLLIQFEYVTLSPCSEIIRSGTFLREDIVKKFSFCKTVFHDLVILPVCLSWQATTVLESNYLLSQRINVKKKDVPQHGGLLSGNREVNYAIDSDGQYTLESSVGWEAKNIALRQAWEAIADQLSGVISEIKAGKKSALAYHMVKNQMDLDLLCQYSGVARWRVKRHLKPAPFAKLDSATLTPYANLFGISVDQLKTVPDEPVSTLAELERWKTNNS